MAKIGRPKSENVKKKVLSIRVEDSMYKCICDYARKHKMTVTEVVLQGLEKVLKGSYRRQDPICDQTTPPRRHRNLLLRCNQS